MCNTTGIAFVCNAINKLEVKGKRVLEIGSYNENGTVRPIITLLEPKQYIGIDIMEGRNVDIVCKVEDIIKKFGKGSFDLVISTELLEHVQDWKLAVSNMKNVLADGGILILTTRSRGFYYHPAPLDLWRYEISDMKEIFADTEIVRLARDRLEPGVFLKARKGTSFQERNLDDYRLYNIVLNKRITGWNEKRESLVRLKGMLKKGITFAHRLISALESRLFHLK
jgi:SAM-dependent methyltransferase